MKKTSDGRTEFLPELEELLSLARGGCRESIQELCERVIPHLLRVIRQKLNQTPRLRTLFDSDDFLQETRLTLVTKELPGSALESPATFIRYLVVVAENKVHESQRRYFQTRRSSLDRQVALESTEAQKESNLTSHDPSAEEQFLVEEEFEQLLRKLPYKDRPILHLLSQGYNYQEIALILGLHERTVRRIIGHVKEFFHAPSQ